MHYINLRLTYLLTYPKSASALPCEMNKNVLADVAGMIS